jgi:hypothetical protein
VFSACFAFILHYNSNHLFRSLCIIVIVGLFASQSKAQDTSNTVPVNRDTLVRPTDSNVRVPPRVKQNPTTVIAVDSTPNTISDSVISIPYSDSVSMRPENFGKTWNIDTAIALTVQVLRHHPYFDFSSKAIVVPNYLRKVQGKEVMFYALMGLLLVFALIKQGFGKYFNDLFRVFFRTTMKQRQIREQLMQTQFPSLIFNMFFVASAGLYIDFMLFYFKIAPNKNFNNFWLLYVYCCIGLAAIYFGKFIGLKVLGWLLNMKKAADSYIFVVFIINKVIGIFLVPFLILIAFANEPMYSVSLVLSWCGIGALLIYRFILGFSTIRNEVRFNLFHFFLYLCAFEITPLLLIYKLLLLIF